MKNRILVFAEFFPPSERAGGPLRTIEAISQLLSERFLVQVMCSSFDLGCEIPMAEITSDQWVSRGPYSVYYGGNKISELMLAVREMRNFKPDLIFINSFFSPRFAFIPLIMALCFGVKLVCAPRGELAAGALRYKPSRKRIYLFLTFFFWRWKCCFIASSEKEAGEIQQVLKFPEGHCRVLQEPTSNVKLSVTHLLKNSGSLRIFFLARIHPIKNLLFAIEMVSQVGNTSLDIYGPINSVAEKKYWESCASFIEEKKLSGRVRYLGPSRPDDVPAIISRYDLLFAPSATENFGHSILESLRQGCPVLLSDQTPWNDVTRLKAGFAVPLSQPSAFIEKLRFFRDLDNTAFDDFRKNAIVAAEKLYPADEIRTSWLRFVEAELR